MAVRPQDAIKIWLKDKYNIGFVLLIVTAFLLRLYFFIQAYNQPLWWDEAEYMSTAKHWAFGVPYNLNPQRPPLFQLLAVPLLKIGLAEGALKFLLVLVPSTFVIVCIYLLGKELFTKKIALIAAFASSFIWSLLFWSARFQPDYLSLSFQLLSLLFFWKLFKDNKKSHAIYGGVFAALGFYFKISALLVPLSLFLFILFKDGLSFIKHKRYWIALLAFIITLVPFAIWQYALFGNPAAFAPSYIGGTGIGQGWDLGWMVLNYFYQFPKGIFFVLFISGICVALFNLAISFDILLQNKEKRLDANVFSLIILLTLSLFYIFYIRGTIEDRWVFLMIPFVMYFSATGLTFFSEKISPHNKKIAAILIIILLSIFIYYQIQHTNSLVEIKKSSYLPIKEASLWIKDNSNPQDSILSVSYTQTVTYSERLVFTYARLSPENFTKLLDEKKPAYIMLSIIEPNHPDWLITQRRYSDGSMEIVMPFFNSSISIAPQGTLKSLDLKPRTVLDKKYQFDYIYPQDSLNGIFIYKITYLSDNL